MEKYNTPSAWDPASTPWDGDSELMTRDVGPFFLTVMLHEDQYIARIEIGAARDDSGDWLEPLYQNYAKTPGEAVTLLYAFIDQWSKATREAVIGALTTTETIQM